MTEQRARAMASLQSARSRRSDGIEPVDLHKFGIKLFAVDAKGFDILKLIPMYHRWIQQKMLEDLLIDVADYSHVPAGPGVMLIAHEGNYALDETGHERGVVYYSKHPLARRAARALRASRAQDAEGRPADEREMPNSTVS